ncbi:MAG: NTP transferase domain-containing protein [Solirubrobacteraceae bacterium]
MVLAAGAGRRFGGTKQLAELDGRPLLQHAVDAQLAVPALEKIVVVLGHDAPRILSAVDFGNADPLVIDDWSEGQAASLRAGLAAVPAAEAALITLGDQPYITAQVVAMVLDHRRRFTPAVRATYAGAPGHPVLLERDLFADVMQLEGEVGARDLLATVPVREVEAGHLCDPLDVDTKEDLP